MVIPETAEILSEIINVNDQGTEYILLNGSEHKIWLIPKKNIKCGFQIFQPGSTKGRIIKIVLPYIKVVRPVLHLLNIDEMKFGVECNIDRILKSIINKNVEPIYSFYIGDSAFEENRKVVIQISDNTKIFGYAKFSKEETIANSYIKEVETLNWLYSKGISSIPRVIWSGSVNNQFGFIQSTEKSGNEATISYLTAQHWAFLDKANKKTSEVINFVGSEFHKELYEFRLLIGQSIWKNKNLLIDVIDFILEYYTNRPMKVAFFHGDFTPWNICYRGDYIFVFDFEYAHKTFPEWLDPFHFITQVGIMTKNLSGDEIYKQFMDDEKVFATHMENPKINFLCYLIHILYFYYKRWNGNLPEDERCNKVRLQLVKRCYQTLLHLGVL